MKTNNEHLVFIGKAQGEEYYLDFSSDNVRGWTFMGLRPETEESLRTMARDTDPQDILGIGDKEWLRLSQWFDFEAFKNDMEYDWYERHDVQAEREEDGKTLYLGFGSGSDIFHYFQENIVDLKNFHEHFEESTLTDKQIEQLCMYVNGRQNVDTFKMTDEEKKAEKEVLADILNYKYE